MAATFAFRKRIQLADGSELWIVREDRDPCALISITEANGKVRKRLTVELSKSEAMTVAQVLAGIFDAMGDGDVQFGEDDEEDTLPGRRVPASDDEG